MFWRVAGKRRQSTVGGARSFDRLRSGRFEGPATESLRLCRRIVTLSDWPATQVDLLRRVLKGEALVSASEALEIERSLPHGHVAAALGTLRHIGLESDVACSFSPQRDLVCALIVAHILAPASQPATARGLREQTASSSLGTLGVDEDHLYEAMDGLLSRQARIEDKLAGPICKKDRWCSTMSPRFTSKAGIVR